MCFFCSLQQLANAICDARRRARDPRDVIRIDTPEMGSTREIYSAHNVIERVVKVDRGGHRFAC